MRSMTMIAAAALGLALSSCGGDAAPMEDSAASTAASPTAPEIASTAEPQELAEAPADLPGGRIAFSRQRSGADDISIMNTDGTGEVQLTHDGARNLEPEWSPNGRKIAFSSNKEGHFDIYVMDDNGQNLQRLTDAPANDSVPKWSPDGKRIAFFSTRSPTFLWVMDADGGNQKAVLPEASEEPLCGGGGFPGGWSPDSRQLTFFIATVVGGETLGQICVVRLDGSELRVLATDPPGLDVESTWSHDGTMIAFRSTRDAGNSDVYVMAADGSNQTRLTRDPATDSEPSFSADDRWLVFHSSRNALNLSLYAIRVDGTGLFRLTHNPANDNTPAWSPR